MVAVHAAVQLQHVFAARRLVQAVNVLRDDGFQLTGLLQPRKGKVRRVRLRLRVQHFVAVKAEELLRPAFEKIVGQNFLRRPAVFLVIQPVRAAEIRDAGLRGHTGSAEKDDIVTCFDPGF